jgi:hydrazine synthase alpha subunit-like protein
MAVVKFLTLLVALSAPSLLWAVAPVQNPRWVSEYFGKVYAAESPHFVQGCGWIDSLLKSREQWATAPDAARTVRAADVLWADFCQVYPMPSDWLIQDRPEGVPAPDWGERLVRQEIDCGLLESMLARTLRSSVFRQAGAPRPQVTGFSDVAAGLAEYERICLLRRNLFLSQIPDAYRRLVFVKLPHTVISGANHYSYTESLSDHPSYRTFRPGGALCTLSLDGRNDVSIEPLLETTNGSLRDPEVSHDGERLLFSWRKSGDQDDYHLHEMNLISREIRQLTEGLGHADYEAIYAPNGDIVFNSTRCVQTIDCDMNVVSNLYTCDKDGRFMRRLGFDQVTVNYPKLLHDGRVIYTRWEYNDRSQQWPQPLFQMNPDGTMQTEYYGNNSWFPTTILHARPIPESRKLIAVLSGHHAHQKGKLAILNVERGNQEAEGVTLVAPVSNPEAEHADMWGTEGDQFKYPYAVDEDLFLVSLSAYEGYRASRGMAETEYEGYKPFGGRTLAAPFWLYVVNREGERELLAADESFSCLQAVSLTPRKRPPTKPSPVDYHKKDGVVFLQDVYQGQGLKGIERGAIRSIRVVELLYRHYSVGRARQSGPGDTSNSHTPVALNNGSYDAKRVLGEARVHEDGSACFKVPARTPVYFQAIDHNGHVAQTMRSWATLQPGEAFGCVGCHETKYDTPVLQASLASKTGPQELTPFYGSPRPFSYPKEVQPIWDRHCVSCHDGERVGVEPSLATTASGKPFSLRGDEAIVVPEMGRKFSDSYLYLCSTGKKAGEPVERYSPNPLVNWMNVQEVPTLLPPYHAGSAKSGLIPLLEEGHEGVELSQKEMDKIACWIDLLVPYCGDYRESNTWTVEEIAEYERRVEKRETSEAEERENIRAYLESLEFEDR